MIVVPYVDGMLRPRTARIEVAEFVRLPADDPQAYWRLLVRLYEHGSEFLIIEHDNWMSEGMIDEIMECPEPWCIRGYDRGGAIMLALGVFRLRADVHRAYPDLLRREVPPIINFDQCDGWFYTRLQIAGYKPHRHFPDADHDQSAKRALFEYDVRGYVVNVKESAEGAYWTDQAARPL
jgi:hypothetical protein